MFDVDKPESGFISLGALSEAVYKAAGAAFGDMVVFSGGQCASVDPFSYEANCELDY